MRKIASMMKMQALINCRYSGIHKPSYPSFYARHTENSYLSTMFPQQSQSSRLSCLSMSSSTQPAFVAYKCVSKCFLYGGIWSPSTSFI